MKSLTQSWFGRCALSFRLTRPTGMAHAHHRSWCAPVPIAAHDATQSHAAHQTLDGAARRCVAFALQLPPDLVSAVDPQVGLLHPFDAGHQFPVSKGLAAEQGRITLPGSVLKVCRWSDLKQPADRLDPMLLAVPVHEAIHHLSRRSSSAWAKNALASLRISLAGEARALRAPVP